MAYLDTADLLARAKRILNRPSSDAALADADWYTFLTDAQERAFHDLAPRVPKAMVGAPVALTSSDSGATYGTSSTFYAGHARVYATRSDIPDNPLVEGQDYLFEGDVIRIPNNRTRTFPDGGPWLYGLVYPGVIDGSTEPTLVSPARRLIVYGAVSLGAERLSRDTTPYEVLYEQALQKVLLTLRTAFGPGGDASGWTRRVTRSGGIVP